jgi:phytoene/squalene synthetase
MRVTYERLLDEIEESGFRVFDGRIRLSLPVRAWATLRALLGTL